MPINYDIRMLINISYLLSGGTKVRPYDLYPNSNLDPNHSIVAQSFQQKLQDMQSLPFPRRNMSLGLKVGIDI